jgi:hypothetical protein
MMQLYIRIRNGIFSESGYCLDAPQLKADTTGYFRKMDADGRSAVELDPIAGCDGSGGKTICVDLHPYPDAAKAKALLQVMCSRLEKAVAGDAEARVEMAACWSSMLVDALALTKQNEKTQLDIVRNIFGTGRVMDALNKHGTVAFLGEPDWQAMLDEALPVAAGRIAA